MEDDNNDSNITNGLIIESKNDRNKIISYSNVSNIDLNDENEIRNKNRPSLAENKQSYRSIDSTIKTTKKGRSADLTCVICGGLAFGYNFSQISCNSCKEFFRRNALLPKDKIKCLNQNNISHNNRCEIRFDLTRKCQYCRLHKCFQSGMRKDFLLSQEQKRLKQQYIEQNRLIRLTQINNQVHKNKKNLLETQTRNKRSELDMISPKDSYCFLKNTDRSTLEYIQNSFISGLQSVPSLSTTISFNNIIEKKISLMDATEIDSYNAIKLIHFLQLIPEFKLINEQDRFTIVKYNMSLLMVLHDILVFDPIDQLWYYDRYNSSSSISSSSDEAFAHHCKSLYILTYGYDMMRDYISCNSEILNAIDNDRIIILLLMLIIIYSRGLSVDDDELPIIIDNQWVLNAHLKYTDLLFRYLIERFTFNMAIHKMIIIIKLIFDIQKHDKILRQRLKNKINMNQISPLMGSLFRI